MSKYHRKVYLPLVVLCLLLLYGCQDPGNTAAPTPTTYEQPTVVRPTAPPPTLTPTPNSVSIVLPSPVGLRSIVIEDDWDGLNPAAPLLAHYNLRVDADEARGQAEFSVGGRRPDKLLTGKADVVIPGQIVDAFLDRLSGIKAQEGAPRRDYCCDDYPSLKIELQFDNETITFFSFSPGNASIATPEVRRGPWSGISNYVPWGVTFQGKTYVINSPEPAEALALLHPYLKKDVQDQLILEQDSRP